MEHDPQKLRGWVAEVVAAYLVNANVGVAEIPGIIASIAQSLTGLGELEATSSATSQALTPSQIRKSITLDHLVSFEDSRS